MSVNCSEDNNTDGQDVKARTSISLDLTPGPFMTFPVICGACGNQLFGHCVFDEGRKRWASEFEHSGVNVNGTTCSNDGKRYRVTDHRLAELVGFVEVSA